MFVQFSVSFSISSKISIRSFLALLFLHLPGQLFSRMFSFVSNPPKSPFDPLLRLLFVHLPFSCILSTTVFRFPPWGASTGCQHNSSLRTLDKRLRYFLSLSGRRRQPGRVCLKYTFWSAASLRSVCGGNKISLLTSAFEDCFWDASRINNWERACWACQVEFSYL